VSSLETTLWLPLSLNCYFEDLISFIYFRTPQHDQFGQSAGPMHVVKNKAGLNDNKKWDRLADRKQNCHKDLINLDSSSFHKTSPSKEASFLTQFSKKFSRIPLMKHI